MLPGVRHRCLATIVKTLYFSTPQQLEAALADLPISSFIASLLGGRDAKAQAYALQVRSLVVWGTCMYVYVRCLHFSIV